MGLIEDLLSRLNVTFTAFANQLNNLALTVGQVNTSVTYMSRVTTENSTTLGLINTTVENIQNNGVSVDLTPVLNAIAAVRYDTTSPHLATVTDVLTALAGLASSTSAPTWYTAPTSAPSTDDIAYAVWRWDSANQYLDGSGRTLNMQQICEVAALREILNQAWFGYPLPTNPLISFVSANSDTLGPSGWQWANVNTFGAPDVPDLSAWQVGDTTVSFLQRTQSAFGWTDTGPSGTATPSIAWKQLGSPPFVVGWYRSNFDPLVVSTNYTVNNPPAPTPPPLPPVVPATSSIHYGSVVSLVNGLNVTGPLDGVVVTITGHPAGAGRFAFGSVDSWRYVGGVIFSDDAGHWEGPQQIGLDSQVIVPRTLAHAAAARFSVNNAAWTGTVQPFTVS